MRFLKMLIVLAVVVPIRLFCELVHILFYPLKFIGETVINFNERIRFRLRSLYRPMMVWINK